MCQKPLNSIRRGFTLLELMLVLAILVAVAALAIPSLWGTLKTQRLRGAADIIRGEWANARVRAMETGEVVVFEFELQGNRFRLVPVAAAFTAITNSAAAARQNNMVPAAVEMFGSDYDVLPDEITFRDHMSDVDTREASLAGGTPGISSGTVRRVYFYPDGTTSTTRVSVADPRGMYLDIDLRGLTGIAQVSDILP